MSDISKTFCPAKWDEVIINLEANYAYACCKGIPTKINKKEDIEIVLTQQRKNLIDGIQDASCSYCWKIEQSGHKSLRHQYLDKFDIKKYPQYVNNQVNPRKIEISLGNKCNFQCTYCNPKFSSQWEADVKQQPYKIFSDRFFYTADTKNKEKITDTIEWLQTTDNIDLLEIIGGEPLENKNFFKIIDSVTSSQLSFATNLSCKKTQVLDDVLHLSNRYKRINIGVSLDSTGKNAEFSRYGLDYQLMLRNLNYLVERAKGNIFVNVMSTMTSITIRDLSNITKLMEELHSANPTNVSWTMNYCRDPQIFTLDTLPEKFKPDILNQLELLENKSYIHGVGVIKGAVQNSKFNKTLYGQMQYFLEEFSQRKNIEIPMDILDA